MNKFDMSWQQLQHIPHVFMSDLESSVQKASESLEEKRKQALEYLGSDHVLHPNYQERARHSPFREHWQPNRYLFDVEIKASAAGRI